MLSCRGLFRFTVAVVAVAVCTGAMAQDPEAEANAAAVKAPISALPKGPYSQWTEPQRQSAFGQVRGFCQFLCVDKYANTAFPDHTAAERTAAVAKVCLGACIAGHLPADYPKLAELKQQLRADYDKAKQLGSAIPWPLPGK